MPNPGDFDPAKAIQDLRQEEEDEQQQRDLHRANILKLLRHAEKKLEEIRNPVVSEFVLTETWWTQESKQISVKRAPEDFKRELRADQTIIGTPEKEGGFFRPRYTYTVATSHKHERQTRYYGSWLLLESTSYNSSYRRGLVKLRQPRAGYVSAQINGWDPRNVGHVTIESTDHSGREKGTYGWRIHESLEDAAAAVHTPEAYRAPDAYHIEQLTTRVKQALDFVATGQPPEPFTISNQTDWD